MVFALILSGGIGTRMRQDGFPKQYIKVNKKPVLIYTLEKFEQCSMIDQVILVADEQWKEKILEWLDEYHIKKITAFAKPGSSRQGSIVNGLSACVHISGKQEDRVVIHDAARPMVSDTLITECLKQLDTYDGCMPVLPINDTVYQSNDGKSITHLLDRNTLFAGQAPEAFKLMRYWEINRNATEEEINNTRGTSEIAYRNGLNISLIPGEDINFKLTTPADLEHFKALMGENHEII
ncbi:MAG: 2-C-methyl-D-erythritol 4-phosphate cytidylyltransferase [Clostridiales bacterium]|nr:2-C-methyl-D-erythritol 4-phosphate cytidylyltransferase [Clostridiales bacterium]